MKNMPLLFKKRVCFVFKTVEHWVIDIRRNIHSYYLEIVVFGFMLVLEIILE